MRYFELFGAAVVLSAVAWSGAVSAQQATVIELTQVGCQFLESENGTNHGFSPKSAEDCNAINAKTGAQRLAEAESLKLKPGKYIFRVTNKNVPYELGFWLRESDYQLGNPIHKLTKTSVSGGGLETGKTQDYEVEIEAGKSYIYSCPLNPTPNYSIIVN